MACECTLRGPAEGKVHLALPMQVLVQTDDTLKLSESSMLFTEVEASMNIYLDPISFNAEKLYDRDNSSTHILSQYTRLERVCSLPGSIEGNAAMEMRLRYHPATWDGGHNIVDTPKLRTCCVIDNICCTISNELQNIIQVPVGRIKDKWIVDVSTAACIFASAIFLLVLIMTRK